MGAALLLLLFANMTRTALLCIKYRPSCKLLDVATRWRRIFSQRGCFDVSWGQDLKNGWKHRQTEALGKRINFCVFRESNVFPNPIVRSPDHIRCPDMELKISNKLSSPASLSIRVIGDFPPTHSHIKPSHLPPDNPNPPIHLQPHRQILRELPCTPKLSHS